MISKTRQWGYRKFQSRRRIRILSVVIKYSMGGLYLRRHQLLCYVISCCD